MHFWNTITHVLYILDIINIEVESSYVLSQLTIVMLESFRIYESTSNGLNPMFIHGIGCSYCVFPICNDYVILP